MSFILDALRRAETARGEQPQPAASTAVLDGVAEPSTPPVWRRPALLLALTALIVILGLAYWRGAGLSPGQTVTRPGIPATAPPVAGLSADTPLAEAATPARREIRALDEVARASEPPGRITASTPAASPPGGTVTLSQQPLSAESAPSRRMGNLPPPQQEQPPSYTTVLLSGRAALPPFHLDIHVYAESPERRFVFVNNRKYREGDALEEGGSVERITPTGVILNHRGHRFELAPD